MSPPPPQQDDNGESDDDTIIKRKMSCMGIDIVEPTSRKEMIMAEAFDAFSHYVLYEENDKCHSLIEKYLNNDVGQQQDQVGELAGGTSQNKIYRITILDDDDDNRNNYHNMNVTKELLNGFYNTKVGKRCIKTMTISKLKQYMIGMCSKRSSATSSNNSGERGELSYRLGNVMFILNFNSPTTGQVRHIDCMVSNIQIMLYMSSNCQSTIVYEPDGKITNTYDLIEFWNTKKKQQKEQRLEKNDDKKDGTNNGIVPDLIQTILKEKGDMDLNTKWYTKQFGFWKTINNYLYCFGKLYLPVKSKLCLSATNSGTTLLAGGNEIHAGPPSNGPRMLAFAIGIPPPTVSSSSSSSISDLDPTTEPPENLGQLHEQQKGSSDDDDNEDNDGEVQYNLTLFHLDLCCIVFCIMDCEYSHLYDQNEQEESKLFMLYLLLPMIREYPNESYERLIIDVDRRDKLCKFIGSLVKAVTAAGNNNTIKELLHDAINTDELLFFGPDIPKRQINKLLKKKKKCEGEG